MFQKIAATAFCPLSLTITHLVGDTVVELDDGGKGGGGGGNESRSSFGETPFDSPLDDNAGG